MKKNFGMVFPGQGSQKVGMLVDIAKEYKVVTETYAAASAVLGYDLWQLVAAGPAEQLNQTEYTQPALLVGAYALWQIITEQHHLPCLLAGHSLGEYTALLCSGALNFAEAVALVAARGRYMQEALPVGAGGLAVIVGLDDVMVQELCQEITATGQELLEPANFNSQGQIVVAGHLGSLLRGIALAKARGAKIAKLLPVSVPAHCSLMKDAAAKLEALLTTITIKTPQIKVINNVDAVIYSGPDSIRSGLIRQLYMPVRWVATIHEFISYGITNIIECGPGRVLTGLNRRISAELSLLHADGLSSLRELLDTYEIE
jgi:[acyl-carrier-protein] S-malonyltransferase